MNILKRGQTGIDTSIIPSMFLRTQTKWSQEYMWIYGCTVLVYIPLSFHGTVQVMHRDSRRYSWR